MSSRIVDQLRIVYLSCPCYFAMGRTGSYVLASFYLGCMATTHRIVDDAAAVESQLDRQVTEMAASIRIAGR